MAEAYLALIFSSGYIPVPFKKNSISSYMFNQIQTQWDE